MSRCTICNGDGPLTLSGLCSSCWEEMHDYGREGDDEYYEEEEDNDH